jgi:hypothetical protein
MVSLSLAPLVHRIAQHRDPPLAKHKSVLGYLISLNGFLTAIKSTKGVKALVLP